MELLKKETENRVLFAGAGITGLEAARLWSEQGFDCVVVERTGGVGGVWNLSHGSANLVREEICGLFVCLDVFFQGISHSS